MKNERKILITLEFEKCFLSCNVFMINFSSSSGRIAPSDLRAVKLLSKLEIKIAARMLLDADTPGGLRGCRRVPGTATNAFTGIGTYRSHLRSITGNPRTTASAPLSLLFAHARIIHSSGLAADNPGCTISLLIDELNPHFFRARVAHN